MRLNLPILDQLKDSQNILIAGAGGGFDIFAGLPIYFTLREMGKTVHLANYSFMDFQLAQIIGETNIILETLLMTPKGKLRRDFLYYPEGYLVQWFLETTKTHIPVWMFAKRGLQAIYTAYQSLIAHLGEIDAIILIDGGVDSLMRGDEQGAGTLLEDTISIGAVEQLDVPVKIIASLGFGTEVEESVCHYLALENMADLIKAGGFYGTCALTPQMPAFQQYESACRFAWEQTAEHHKSHISTRVIPAVHGEFGDYHMYDDDRNTPVLISPLMSIYWFFDLATVAERNLLIPELQDTLTFEDALQITMQHRAKLTPRQRRSIPY